MSEIIDESNEHDIFQDRYHPCIERKSFHHKAQIETERHRQTYM